MGDRNTAHDTMMAGLLIEGQEDTGGPVVFHGFGTLTGLATKIEDGSKVLVTNRHVMTGSGHANPVGQPFMEQANRKVADNFALSPIVLDTATLDVAVGDFNPAPNISANFSVHDLTHSNTRKIIEGTVAPEPRMRLLMAGGVTGLREVVVTEVNASYSHEDWPVSMQSVFKVSTSPIRFRKGDSGSPLLYHVGNNQYKMCGIYFAGEHWVDDNGVTQTDNSSNGLACLASIAESVMGIKFGKRAPSANAGYDHLVGPGNTVTLDGSGTTDPDGDTLTYLWEQVPDVQHTVALSSATAVSPTFTAPSTPATLSFRLTVTNSYGMTDTDTVSVTVRPGAESLERLAHGQTYTRTGSWTTEIASANRSGRYAKFYGFSLSQSARVRIDLSSSENTYLFLMSGAGTSGSVLAYNDDSGGSLNSRIDQELEAGSYTIEATTYSARREGSFTLAVQVYNNDATLSGLSLEPASASLAPAFAADEESYTASVSNAISSVRVTPTVNQANATVTVNGAAVTSGQPSGPISLSVGENTITVMVTAEDGSATKTYTVDVTRAATPAPTSTPTPTPAPDPTPPPQPVNTWVATGNTRGCGPTYEYEESLYSGSGALYFRWVSDPQPDPWGAWSDTGNTMSIGGGVWVKEQTRTSDCGNTETQWVQL